jgi:hypothetical protein
LKRTDYLLVGPILSRSNVYKVEQSFAASEAANKILESGHVVDAAATNECFGKASDVGVYSAQYAGFGGDRIALLEVSRYGGMKLSGSLTAALLALANEVIAEDHAVAVDEHDDEGIAELACQCCGWHKPK